MLIALAVVAALAVAFLVMFVMAKSSAAEFRAQADARETALVSERDELKETTTRQAGELTDARDDIARLDSELTDKTDEARRLADELEQARNLSTERAAEIEALTATNAGLQSDLKAAEAAAAAATARNVGIKIRGDNVDVGAIQPETLWALELTRSQRTWRTSVAANPTAEEDPFDGNDDPVKRAVEIEAAALRENVGAFITIDWQAEAITEPARQHLVVRVAQEMLEAAARGPEPSRLVVTGGKEVTLRLEAADDGAEDLAPIIPPRISSELVDIRDESGLSITVKTQ